jgi:glutamate 5-kinase
MLGMPRLLSSGAIARGVRIMGATRATGSVAGAASAVGQGKLYRAYDELLRERERVSAQIRSVSFFV